MSFNLQLLRTYFTISSVIAPKFSALQAFNLFQRVRKKNVRKREEEFYKKARHFRIPFKKEDINCYALGNIKGDLIFLVHGWESNAGSMSKFAFDLADKGYRVIAFDLPGHAKSKSNRSNLYLCKEAFKRILEFIEPKEPFSVISHSFGSAVATYTLAHTNYKVDKFIFLTSPNALYHVFYNFKKFIGLTDRSFRHLLNNATSLLSEDVRKVNVDEKLKAIDYAQLLLIHDKYDKIISIENSKVIQKKNDKKSALKIYDKIGHYRMLWNDDVLNDSIYFITS